MGVIIAATKANPDAADDAERWGAARAGQMGRGKRSHTRALEIALRSDERERPSTPPGRTPPCPRKPQCVLRTSDRRNCTQEGASAEGNGGRQLKIREIPIKLTPHPERQ